MSIAVRYATIDELAWLKKENHYLPNGMVKQKIDVREYIVAMDGERLIGYLRFSYFWAFIPYIDIIFVEASYRRQGIGKRMLAQLEQRTRDEGQPIIMSSSQADESPSQAWHRHVGFRDAGALVDLRPLQSITEVVFVKRLG